MDRDEDDGSMYVLWDRVEAWRRYQIHRLTAVALGDLYVSLARAFVELSPTARRRHNCRRSAGLLVRAADQYQAAGLTRRARTVWRYGRFMHRAAWSVK